MSDESETSFLSYRHIVSERRNQMKHHRGELLALMLLPSAWFAFVWADESPYGQEFLEDCLYHTEPDDYFPNGEPPYVPYRYRNSLPEYKVFFERSGWTTNQFIEGLIFAVTNNLDAAKSGDKDKLRIAGRAIWKLSEINDPAVTNFFRYFNDTDDISLFKPDTIPAMVYYTNLEPDVLSYMRTLCARTNIYDTVAYTTARIIYETLDTLTNDLKPAATNRVAKYMYFALHHATYGFLSPDRMLAGFIPAYSNSLQRLEVNQYVAETTTNALLRTCVQQEINRLSAIPTNQLNDISWITEDLNGGH